MKCVLCARHWSVYWGGGGRGRQAVGQCPAEVAAITAARTPGRVRSHKAAIPEPCQLLTGSLLAPGRREATQKLPRGSDLHGSRIPATTLTGGCPYRIPLPRNYTALIFHPTLG